MPKRTQSSPQQRPSIDELRKLSNAILSAQAQDMPRSPEDGDPVALAERIRADALSSTHGATYQWILDRVQIAALISDKENRAFAELEGVRAIADSLAEYLFWKGKGTQFAERIRQLRTLLIAVRLVAAHPNISDRTKAELAIVESQLRWLDGRPKGDLREHYLVQQIYEYFHVVADTDPRAEQLTCLFVAATEKDRDTVLRVVSRHLSTLRKTAADN